MVDYFSQAIDLAKREILLDLHKNDPAIHPFVALGLVSLLLDLGRYSGVRINVRLTSIP